MARSVKLSREHHATDFAADEVDVGGRSQQHAVDQHSLHVNLRKALKIPHDALLGFRSGAHETHRPKVRKLVVAKGRHVVRHDVDDDERGHVGGRQPQLRQAHTNTQASGVNGGNRATGDGQSETNKDRTSKVWALSSNVVPN